MTQSIWQIWLLAFVDNPDVYQFGKRSDSGPPRINKLFATTCQFFDMIYSYCGYFQLVHLMSNHSTKHKYFAITVNFHVYCDFTLLNKHIYFPYQFTLYVDSLSFCLCLHFIFNQRDVSLQGKQHERINIDFNQTKYSSL